MRLQAAVPPDFEPAAAAAAACVLQATVPELVASWTLQHLKVLEQVDLPVHFAWWSLSRHDALPI